MEAAAEPSTGNAAVDSNDDVDETRLSAVDGAEVSQLRARSKPEQALEKAQKMQRAAELLRDEAKSALQQVEQDLRMAKQQLAHHGETGAARRGGRA